MSLQVPDPVCSYLQVWVCSKIDKGSDSSGTISWWNVPLVTHQLMNFRAVVLCLAAHPESAVSPMPAGMSMRLVIWMKATFLGQKDKPRDGEETLGIEEPELESMKTLRAVQESILTCRVMHREVIRWSNIGVCTLIHSGQKITLSVLKLYVSR